MHPDFDPRDLEPSMPRDEPKRRSRLLPLALIGVGTAAVAGVGGWFALDLLSSGPEQTTAQHIRADPSAVRIRPDQPGGLQVPHQDKQVLESPAARTTSAGVERLLPAPEQPVQRPAFGGPVPTVPGFAPPTQTATVNPNAVPPAISPTPPRPAAQPIFPQATPAPAPAPAAAPPARPIPITPPVAAVPAPPVPQAAPRPGVPDVAPLPAPPGRGPVALAAPTPAPAPAAGPQPLQPPAAARAPAPQVAAAPPSGGRRIQLAAVGSRDGATAEWAKMQRAHPELAGLQLTVQQVEINGRPVFRIQAGPLDDDGVRRTCSAVSARGQACIAVR